MSFSREERGKGNVWLRDVRRVHEVKVALNFIFVEALGSLKGSCFWLSLYWNTG